MRIEYNIIYFQHILALSIQHTEESTTIECTVYVDGYYRPQLTNTKFQRKIIIAKRRGIKKKKKL